jgi:hypothetical protein
VFSDAFGGFYLSISRSFPENAIVLMTSEDPNFLLLEILLISISLALIMLGGYKDEGSKNERSEGEILVRYSLYYRSQKLLKFLLVWIVLGALISLFFGMPINPANNFILFPFLMVLYSFTYFFELKIDKNFKSLKCIRSGMVTSNINRIERVTVNDEMVIFHTPNGGEYHFDLSKFHFGDIRKIKEFCAVCI